MARVTVGRVLLTVSSVWAGAGSFVFDWNTTHIYNPAWPPHAKYHNAQTMSTGAALALIALPVIWGRGGWSRQRLQVAAGAASLYWATQLSALAFPGVALLDPPAPSRRFGPQIVVAAVGLAVTALGYGLDRNSLRSRH